MGRESVQPRQIELTTRAVSPNLNRGGVVFMGETGMDGAGSRPGVAGGERVALPIVKPKMTAEGASDHLAALKRETEGNEELRPEQRWATKAWDYVNSLRGESINADERGMQKRLAELGIGPNGAMRADVVANAKLSDEERIEQAERLLGRRLSPEQKAGLIAAHEVGAIRDDDGKIIGWEPGLNGKDTGIFNYTVAQLREKDRFLKDVVEIKDAEERRLLIETGVVGFTVDRTGITDPAILAEFAKAEIVGNAVKGRARLDKLGEYMDRIMSLPGVSEADKKSAINALETVLDTEMASEMGGSSKEDYEAAYAADPAHFRENYLDKIDVHTGPMPTGLMDFIVSADDQELLYQTVIQIVSLSLDAENSDYQLGLYAAGNLDGILTRLGTLQNENSVQKERYERVTKIKQTVGLLHRMNKNLVTGSMQGLGAEAALVAPEHLQTLAEVKGADVIMRLIDLGYLQILAEDQKVTTENSRKLFGQDLNKDAQEDFLKGKTHRARTMGTIETRLGEIQKAKDGARDPARPDFDGNLLFPELAELKPWELVWAFSAGRLLSNISLRSAEHISSSDLRNGSSSRGGGSTYESPPQEYAARLMNPDMASKRFDQSEVAGGMVFLNRAHDHFQALRERQGYGRTRIVSISGKAIREFEVPAMFKLGGIYQGWRQDGMVMSYAPMFFTPDGSSRVERIVTMQEHIHDAKKASGSRIERRLYAERTQVAERFKEEVRRTGLSDGDGVTDVDRARFEEAYDAKLKAYFDPGKFAEMLRIDKQAGGNKLNKELAKAKNEAEPGVLREIFLAPNGELRPEFTNALGVLLRSGAIAPAERDILVGATTKTVVGPDGKRVKVKTSELLEVKAQIRKAIWERIAEENPGGLAMFLSGMDFNSDSAPTFHDGRTLDDFRAFAASLNSKTNETWRNLSLKLTIATEIRMREIAAAQKAAEPFEFAARALEKAGDKDGAVVERAKIIAKNPRTLGEILGSGTGQVSLTTGPGSETELLEEIQAYGKDVAGDMSAVRFAFNPFMNDVVFKTVDHTRPGGNFYQRRVNDLSAINEGWKKINDTVAARPGAVTEKECFEAFHEAVFAIAGPNSLETAQDEVLPFFMAILDFWEEGGQHRDSTDLADSNKIFAAAALRRWLSKSVFYDAVASKTQKSNSLAQVWGSVDHSIAYDEFAMRGAISRAKGASIIRSKHEDESGKMYMDIEDRLKKRYGAKFLQGRFFGLGGILGILLRDMFPMFGLIALSEAGKEARKPVKS